jgi:hypothetical protein
MDETDKILRKLTKMLKGTKSDTCLFCKKKINHGTNPYKKFCTHFCKLSFIYTYNLS